MLTDRAYQLLTAYVDGECPAGSAHVERLLQAWREAQPVASPAARPMPCPAQACPGRHTSGSVRARPANHRRARTDAPPASGGQTRPVVPTWVGYAAAAPYCWCLALGSFYFAASLQATPRIFWYTGNRARKGRRVPGPSCPGHRPIPTATSWSSRTPFLKPNEDRDPPEKDSRRRRPQDPAAAARAGTGPGFAEGKGWPRARRPRHGNLQDRRRRAGAATDPYRP